MALISDGDLEVVLKQVVASALEKHEHDLIAMSPSQDGIERVSEQVLVQNSGAVELLCRISLFNTEALGCRGRVALMLERIDRAQKWKLTSTYGTMGLKRTYFNYEAQEIKGVVQHAYRLCSRNRSARKHLGKKSHSSITKLKNIFIDCLQITEALGESQQVLPLGDGHGPDPVEGIPLTDRQPETVVDFVNRGGHMGVTWASPIEVVHPITDVEVIDSDFEDDALLVGEDEVSPTTIEAVEDDPLDAPSCTILDDDSDDEFWTDLGEIPAPPSSSMLQKAADAPPVDHKKQQKESQKKRKMTDAKPQPKFRLRGKQSISPIARTVLKSKKGKKGMKVILEDDTILPPLTELRVKKMLQRGKRFCQLRWGKKALLQVTSTSVMGDQHAFVATEFLGAMLMNGMTYGAVKQAKTVLVEGGSVNFDGYHVTLKDLYARRPGSNLADRFGD